MLNGLKLYGSDGDALSRDLKKENHINGSLAFRGKVRKSIASCESGEYQNPGMRWLTTGKAAQER